MTHELRPSEIEVLATERNDARRRIRAEHACDSIGLQSGAVDDEIARQLRVADDESPYLSRSCGRHERRVGSYHTTGHCDVAAQCVDHSAIVDDPFLGDVKRGESPHVRLALT